ncbi:unnamed protein product [Phyllotreta striolata]|uniref:Uncharacterized protein n=1 Tax=Phyllotreta striolata TaxID=444603 RepID=A0A9N9TFD4_PHYSR|nr:unnamed protein product [Phyllotreta striolata]
MSGFFKYRDNKSDVNLSKNQVTKKKSRKTVKKDTTSEALSVIDEFQPKNKLDIFEFFFNSFINEIILQREVVIKSVDLDAQSIHSYAHERKEKKDDDTNTKRTSITTMNIFDRAKRRQSEALSSRSSVASGTFPQKLSIGIKPSLDKTNSYNSGGGGLRIGIAQELVTIEKITFKNGNYYEGPCNEYLMHGKGVFIWTDKTIYTGAFSNGYITGKGELILSDLSKYRGDVVQGIFHGIGYFNPAGSPLYYYGEWNNGKKHGKGWLMYDADDWYEGDWNNDLRHGIGFRKYKNGARYKGEWVANKKHGKGKMLLRNNDYYNGEWVDNMPHGYGKYTWDMEHNDAFCFPMYSWYKGSWKHGKRHGVGILNFGTECGAEYAGTMCENSKHGPGVMICGNGIVLESNPLFYHNKPVHKTSQISFKDLTEKYTKEELECNIQKGSYYEILKIVNSKIACSELSMDILVNITKNSAKIEPEQYVKLVDSISGSKKVWCPLIIPIHTIPENVNFGYFIDIVFDYNKKYCGSIECPPEQDILLSKIHTPLVPLRFKRSIMSFRFSTVTLPSETPKYSVITVGPPRTKSFTRSIISDTKSEIIHTAEEKLQLMKIKEAELFKNIIMANRSKLNHVYLKYANFNQDIKETFENSRTVMVRLFLWQLFRDSKNEIELAKVDSLMWENPQSCLSTEHNPFEPIYFYQFLQYIMGCAWITCLKYTPHGKGAPLPSLIFKNFLEDFLATPRIESGTALREHLHLAPLKKVYKLYSSVSEPMSIKTFFNATYRHESEELPCYAAVHSGELPKLMRGCNMVPMAHEIYYVKLTEPLSDYEEEPKIKNNDQFARSLLTFRTLGWNKIAEFIATVCPASQSADQKLNMHYNLTFLEFYEIFIKCAFEKGEELVKGFEESTKYQDPAMSILSPSLFSQKTKSKSLKKNKSKKSTVKVTKSLKFKKK